MNPFDAAYEGTPPWDIGRPQQAFVDLMQRAPLSGRVLDSGCGTGDLAIYLAKQGLDVVGVDASDKAIARAREKARQQGARLDLLAMDVNKVAGLRKPFDAVVDCGMFHTLNDTGAAAYAAMLAKVLRPGGTLHILCFSNEEPDWGGPRRISRAMLEERFAGWWLDTLQPARFETRRSPEGSAAWLASFTFHGKPVTGRQ